MYLFLHNSIFICRKRIDSICQLNHGKIIARIGPPGVAETVELAAVTVFVPLKLKNGPGSIPLAGKLPNVPSPVVPVSDVVFSIPVAISFPKMARFQTSCPLVAE
jgi:hypothetical protein